MPRRRDKDKDDSDGGRLIPADSPFGSPPAQPERSARTRPSAQGDAKKRLFGGRGKKDAAQDDPFPSPPRLEDIGARDPWVPDAPASEASSASRASPGGRPARKPLVTPWVPPLDEPVSGIPVTGPTPPATTVRTPPPSEAGPPNYPPAPRAPVPDPIDNELEFVFAGKDAPGTPKIKPAGGPGPRISRNTALALAVLLLLIAGVVGYALFGGDDETPSPTAAPVTAAPSVAQTDVPTTAPTVALPEECVNSFAFASTRANDENVARTTGLCPTVEQWLEAAKRYPSAIGVASAADVGNDDVLRVCAVDASGAMCLDAANKGILVTPAPSTAPGASPAAPPPAVTPAPTPF